MGGYVSCSDEAMKFGTRAQFVRYAILSALERVGAE